MSSEALALYTPRSNRLDDERRPARYASSWLPFIVSAIVALVIIAIVFPHSLGIIGINPRATVQTVTNQPIAVVAPTSEPRPTQAPIQ